MQATNPIPAQISAAVTAATNNPSFTRLGTNVPANISVAGSGSSISSTTNSGGINYTITVASQTNGFTTLAQTNPLAVLYTNSLPGLTNGFISQADIGSLADTNYVNASTNGFVTSAVIAGLAPFTYVDSEIQSATNGLVTASVTNGLVGPSITNGLASISLVNSLIAPLASISYVNTATNGFITSSALIPYATIVALNAAVAPLASVAYVNTATNGFVTASIINGLASTTYVNTATNTLLASANSAARGFIQFTNIQTLIAITNAIAQADNAKYLNTNQIIQATGFGQLIVNTNYFSEGVNLYWSASGVWYFYDGANWNFYRPDLGILYQMGGTSPVGNTFTVANGINPGSPPAQTVFINPPVSQNEITVISNALLSLPLGGYFNGVVSNGGFSLNGTNAIVAIAQSVSTNGGGATNVFIAAGAGIVVVTNAPSFWTISATGGSGTNGGSATNVFFAPGQNNTRGGFWLVQWS